MNNLLSQFKKIIENRDARHVLAHVVESHGSVPQKVGASMLIAEDGKILGTIGGGLLEYQCIEACKKIMSRNEVSTFEFDMNDDYARDAGPICGGKLKLFLNGRLQNQYERITEIVDFSQKNSSFYVGVNTDVDSDNAGRLFIKLEKPDQTEKSMFWQKVLPAKKIYVVGAGHCGLAIAELAHWLDFEVYLIDERSPDTSDFSFTRFVGNFRNFLQTHPIDKQTAIVLVNKGHKGDAEDLEACIHADAGYIGMIGSQRKVRLLKKHFLEDQITSQEYWNRIYSPIGLDIAAIEVREIALSILTEIVAVFNGKSPDKKAIKCLKL